MLLTDTIPRANKSDSFRKNIRISESFLLSLFANHKLKIYGANVKKLSFPLEIASYACRTGSDESRQAKRRTLSTVENMPRTSNLEARKNRKKNQSLSTGLTGLLERKRKDI